MAFRILWADMGIREIFRNKLNQIFQQLEDEGAEKGPIGDSGLTMSTNRLLGRTTASAGAIEEIAVGAGLSLNAGNLEATGGGGPSPANPTATIGSAPVNGVADTYMRSDAAPAFGNLTGPITSTGLATAVAAQTGTGSTFVMNQSPALVTPDLGTPSAATLTNATGLPISTGVAGLGANVAAFLATPSSANLAAALTDGTGSGAAVFAESPTFSGSPSYNFNGGTVIPRGHISGLALSAPGGIGVFNIAGGQATDSSGVSPMSLGSAYTKTTAAWAVGSGNGSLDTGSIADGWYHVFLIQRPDTGVVDVLTSLSPTAPDLPANYTRFRRIGALQNVGGAWTAFTQDMNEFNWVTPVQDYNAATTSNTPTLVTLPSVPTGVRVKAKLVLSLDVVGGATNYGALSSPDTGGLAANSFTACAVVNGATATAQGYFEVWTNTSAQVYVSVTAPSSQSTTRRIGVLGWTDPRGADQ